MTLNKLHSVYVTLIGSQDDFGARHRIVNGFSMIGVFVTVVWCLTDFVFGRGINIYSALISFAASALLFVTSRVLKKQSGLITGAVMLVYMCVFAGAWFRQGGVLGSSAFLILLLMPASLLVVPGRGRYSLFILFAMVFAGLTSYEVVHPSVQVHSIAGESRLLESIICFAGCSAGILALFSTGIRSLRTEKARTREYTDQIEALASTDVLTGLLTHTAIWKLLDEEHARCARTGRPYSIVMLDLDSFKSVNDEFGHHHGDVVLQQTGREIQSAIRVTDRAGRYGGEEFLVLLPDTTEDGAVRVAARIMLMLAGVRVSDTRTVMCSIGVVSHDGDSPDRMVDRADDLLYGAKRKGGARIALSGGRYVTLAECVNVWDERSAV